MYPQRLKSGDVIRIIAPSKSLSVIDPAIIEMAEKRLCSIGLKVTYGENVKNKRLFYDSASVAERVDDLHNAFEDRNVKAILTAVGGYNSNQLLAKIDYELIKNNPKILCGLSDITALQNAIYKMAGLVTFSGPHFSNFGMLKGFEYTLKYFVKMLFEEQKSIDIISSKTYSSDLWYLDQDNREFEINVGMIPFQEGDAEGVIVGGNLCTFNLLQGTEFMPCLKDKILFLEDNGYLGIDYFCEFDRNLESLSQLPFFDTVKAIVIGRTDKSCNMSIEKWKALLSDKPYLKDKPIVINADFGHTTPIITFPIGGKCKVSVNSEGCRLTLFKEAGD